ncbi:MAG: hypothetical protein AAFV29_02990 [Myxococcota bacterium]
MSVQDGNRVMASLGTRLAQRPAMIKWMILALVALSTTGCGLECTAIGCLDGVFISVEDSTGQRVETYTGTIAFDALSAQFECPTPAGGGCFDGEVFLEIPAALRFGELDIESSRGTFSGSVQIEYQDQLLNGEGCGVTCSQGRLQLIVDG